MSAHDENSTIKIRVQLRDKGPSHVLTFASRIEGYPNLRYALCEDTFTSLGEKSSYLSTFRDLVSANFDS